MTAHSLLAGYYPSAETQVPLDRHGTEGRYAGMQQQQNATLCVVAQHLG